MFVLDTNTVSELRKVRSGKANPGVGEWAAAVASAQLFVSVITIHEIEHGVLLAERSDPDRGAVLRAWLDHSVSVAFAERVLPVDEAVARRAAGLHVPDPAPFRDALIGATALVHYMAVVTRNAKDFERFAGLEVLNPWNTGS
ncbi:MAG: PIN domain-containing protein [Acidimicrobiales bacterium]